ncbi:hypothetical protein MKW94_017199 [Papaver nudicaule]|uniref:Myb/SANT-like domain-containing protein n=1 Tax=Papaver nudicaule TaxID=74823 RepID=A0AA42B3L2_PAPNU|nr:hypothetical protein [Papaver nudicaule]
MDSRPSRGQTKYDMRARWTTALSEKFATLLIEQIKQGNRSNNIFSKTAWKNVRCEFNKQTGNDFDRKQLKNHLDVLRKRYTITKSLLNQAEFQYDESQHMVIADNEVWERCIKANPDAESIKIKGCPVFKLLCLVFSETGLDGQESLYKLKPALEQADSQHDERQFEQDQARARWSETMDKIFTDLMVEQVRQGNRMNNIFNKKAWKYIHDEFNRQTGLNFNRKQLKNHHNVLRRIYGNVRSLLDQEGFSWDETNCMVIAENELWEKSVKGHPEVETIRIKGCFLYRKLSTLFSESVNGRYSQSSHDFESDKAVDGTDTAWSSEESPETANTSVNPVTQSPSARDEASSRSDGQNSKRQLATLPSLSGNQKRICRRADNATVVDGMREMGSSSRSKTTALPLKTGDQFSISNCARALNEMQGVDEILYLAAMDMFEDDPVRRETFISIRSDIRLAWLKSKCNVHL